MSNAVVVPFEADPAFVLIRTSLRADGSPWHATTASGPALYLGAPVAAGWAAWAARLDTLLASSCRVLAGRQRRARRVTVTLTYADGRRRRRSMTLSRATNDAREILPAALGALRLLVDERPGVASKLSVQLTQVTRPDGRMVASRPVRFARRAPRTGLVVRHAWMRALAAVALLVGTANLLPLG